MSGNYGYGNEDNRNVDGGNIQYGYESTSTSPTLQVPTSSGSAAIQMPAVCSAQFYPSAILATANSISRTHSPYGSPTSPHPAEYSATPPDYPPPTSYFPLTSDPSTPTGPPRSPLESYYTSATSPHSYPGPPQPNPNYYTSPTSGTHPGTFPPPPSSQPSTTFLSSVPTQPCRHCHLPVPLSNTAIRTHIMGCTGGRNYCLAGGCTRRDEFMRFDNLVHHLRNVHGWAVPKSRGEPFRLE